MQLESGECKAVTPQGERDALACYDNLAYEWIAEAGAFEVLIGASSQDIPATATLTFTGTSRWPS